MEREERTETTLSEINFNKLLSPTKTKVPSSTDNVIKTPRRLKVNLDKGDLEKQSQNVSSYTIIEVESTTKPMAEVSPQKVNIVPDHQSPKPEIKKRKRGRPSTKEDKTAVPLKKRSSSRSTKGRHSSGNSSFATTTSPLRSNITKRKHNVGVFNDDEDNLLALAYEVKADTDLSIPNANRLPSVSNGVIVLPNRKSPGIPGTARKRISGEGKVASLQRIMLELPNLCDPNVFTDILMKTYGSRFEASRVFECLKTSELKEAITKRFTPWELMTLIQKNDSATGKFLTMISTDDILHEVQSREELRNSEKLLDVFSCALTKKALINDNILKKVLDVASVDTIINTVNARSDLKNSEKLFNVLLHNLPKKISEEMKKSVIKVLIEKFTTSELVDISHEAIRSSVDKYYKN